MMSSTEWTSLIDWALKGLLSGLCMYAVHVMGGVKVSIDSLNEKMARIIERTEWHSREIEKLEARIMRLELKL